ncbi:cytochrome c-551 precursor [Leptothrix cholodnii SP-6]|uniref:Cytochrome c-551 n=1 Tax=Leptothrix cholodnii (strain ATCC 51168 / LMG 8142 / SP-6) TaxID=395495 RepID=B1XWH5_LEPCP|nr:c-type cytochrome [Leptothrix cholodnii]ACB33843.1 cytochrome c-551 precursor [Leptothrix cholodnii SP-6]
MTSSLARTTLAACSLLAALSLSTTARAAAPSDDAMLKLASTSGCMTCHHVDPGAKGPEGLPPIGPAWRDVAAKYKGDKTAAANLTQVVLKGSNPYDSHWKGKASGLAMPPNAVAIKPAEVKQLVGWILNLQSK